MKCFVCNADCELELHYFFSGLCGQARRPGQNPDKEWYYKAPLYHVSEGEGFSIGFCSPDCSLDYHKSLDKSVRVE